MVPETCFYQGARASRPQAGNASSLDFGTAGETPALPDHKTNRTEFCPWVTKSMIPYVDVDGR